VLGLKNTFSPSELKQTANGLKMKTFVTSFITSFVISIAVALIILLSNQTVQSEQVSKMIRYSEYGAVGDGVADDFDAIINAHTAANKAGSKVGADIGAVYYIGGANKTANIQTDVDWGNAKFIIDDTKVENRNRNIFQISSKFSKTKIKDVKTLKKNQRGIDLTLPHDSLVIVTDETTKHFIRYGANQNNGTNQTDVFIVGKNGKVDMKSPIIWDFNNITLMTAFPMDSETLTVRGGSFTTIANQAESKYTYYARGINITRSNVVIDGVSHTITEEPEHGAPYGGFISISNCADVTVQNCKLSGHKIYSTIGNAGIPVSMGSYDISVGKAVNVTFKNCKQLNDIHNPKLWGIFGSNFSKNITFDTVEFSRFDAHMGVVNATIKNSVLGHQGINLIGKGLFLIENSKVCGRSFINLRGDYGSTWEGDIIIRNCEYVPRNGKKSDAVLLAGSNSGQHDFGYTCYMPKKITIDGLVINDSNSVNNYKGPKIFSSFNNAYKNEEYKEMYPYIITKEVEIKNLTIKSGQSLLVSDNMFMFRNVKITEK
jgi:hypothetical protein